MRKLARAGLRCSEFIYLETKLHEFIALSLLVVGRQVIFLLAVGNGEDVSWLIDTALQFALVARWVWIGIYWIDGGVSSLSVSRVRAVTPVDGVKESVEEASATFDTLGVEDVIGLEQNAVLGVDDGYEIWKSRSDSPPA